MQAVTIQKDLGNERQRERKSIRKKEYFEMF